MSGLFKKKKPKPLGWQVAFAIWTGKLPGPPGQFYALGIQAIETGILEVRDTLIDQTSSAFLHA